MTPGAFSGQPDSSQAIWPAADWWHNLGSGELTDLIGRAQAENRDLAAAVARVLQAQARVTVQRAPLFPQINGQSQAQRTSVNAAQSTGGQGQSAGSATSNTFTLNASAGYELDIWGQARNNLRAARETLKSARFDQQSVALTVTANVATTYFSVLALRERTAIANEDIAAIKSILDVISLKVSAGTSSHLDLAQEQAQLEGVQAQLAALEQSELETRVNLAILLGQPPQTLRIAAQGLQEVSPPAVAPGLPSELLIRRPDVAEAEAKLASAHANLDAARAAFLPQFSLTGSGGYASSTIGALVRGPSFVWDAGAGVLQTIFDGGRLLGQKNLALGVQQELIAD